MYVSRERSSQNQVEVQSPLLNISSIDVKASGRQDDFFVIINQHASVMITQKLEAMCLFLLMAVSLLSLNITDIILV